MGGYGARRNWRMWASAPLLVCAGAAAAALGSQLASAVAFQALSLDDAGACAVEDCDATVSLLQTGISASVASQRTALLQASAQSGAGVAMEMSSEAVAEAGGRANGAAAMPTSSASKPGTALLYLLPIIGFVLALGAIAVTVYLEVGWPGGTPPTPRKPFSEPHTRPFAPRAAGVGAGGVGGFGGGLVSAGAARGGRGAEGLLAESPHTGGGFLPPPVQRLQEEHYSQTAAIYGQTPLPPPEGYYTKPAGGAGAQAPAASPPLTTEAYYKPLGPQVQIVVPTVPAGGVLGLNLSETDLSVTSFAKPAAKAYGFEVGDRLLAINGIPVAHQDDFVYWLRVAMDRNISLKEPIVFTVFRGPLPQAAAAGPGAEADQEFEGTWEYEHKAGHGSRECTIRRHLDGALHFEQQLPTGEEVHGALNRTGASSMEGDLMLAGGQQYGLVRVRLGGSGAVVNFWPRAARSWGEDLHVQRRGHGGGRAPSPKGPFMTTPPSATGGPQLPPTATTANPWDSMARPGSPHERHGSPHGRSGSPHGRSGSPHAVR